MSRTLNKETLYLGVDIGGTKVAAGLVTASGRIVSRAKVPMQATGDAAAGLAAVMAAIAAAQGKHAKPTAIGVSSPGPLDPRKGVVINPPNLPCWRNFPLARRVQATTRIPTFVDNDANAAALAEARWGAGRGLESVFYATLGTGIGSGLVLDGKLYHGRTGAAAEGGHLSIDCHGVLCACGKRGCIEALAAGPAVGKRARARVANDRAGGRRMLELAGGELEAITAEVTGTAWREGDLAATAVLRETADLLAIWLGNVVDILEPSVIIFGGGMGKLMGDWFPHIREQMRAWTINSRASEIPLRKARYGADSGIAGGAALCLGR